MFLLRLVIILHLIFYPNIVLSQSIYNKLELGFGNDCLSKNTTINLIFTCYDQNLQLNNEDQIIYLEILRLIDLSIQRNFITNKQGIETVKYINNLEYWTEYKPQKLEKIVKESKCLDKDNFDIFIDCFYKNFRTLKLYVSSRIDSKNEIEKLMFNAINLSKNEGLLATTNDTRAVDTVYSKDRSATFGQGEFKEKKGGQIDFFINELDRVGLIKHKKYVKEGETNEELKKIIMFIIIAIIIALIAKKLIKAKSGGSKSSGGTTSTQQAGTTAVKPYGQQTYAYSTGPQFSGPFLKGLFKSAPPQSFLHKPGFKLAIARGGFF